MFLLLTNKSVLLCVKGPPCLPPLFLTEMACRTKVQEMNKRHERAHLCHRAPGRVTTRNTLRLFSLI